jgi:mannose PTS system EIIA component
MVGKIIITQGGLAQELLDAARIIVGPFERFEAVSLGWGEDPAAAKPRLAQAIARVDTGDGVLLLTDMFGSTPSNLAMSFLESGKVDMLAGANLPIVVRLAGTVPEGLDPTALAHWVQGKGRSCLCVGSDSVRERTCDREGQG